MSEEIKVSEMPEPTDLKNEDIIMIIQNGINRKCSMGFMQKYFEEKQVIVSPTTPTTNEKVWFKRGKNLVNKWVKGEFYNTEEKYFAAHSEFARTDFIEINIDTDYTLSNSENDKYGQICVFDEEYNYLEKVNQDDLLLSFKITNTKAKYIVANIYYRDYPNLNWIQIEQGTTASSYESYVKKQIRIKNSNNVYETFYEENENNIKGTLITQAVVSSKISQVDINKIIINNKSVDVTFRGLVQTKINNNENVITGLPNPAGTGGKTILSAIGTEYAVEKVIWEYFVTGGEIRGEEIEAGKWIHISFTYLLD